jgi:hypothetical protein
MDLFLKREEITSFLKEKKLYDGTEKIIWANISNAQGPMVVLVFNRNGVLTLPITPMGKIKGDIIVTGGSEIDSIKFKKGLIAYKLYIDSSTMDIPVFRVNKMMLGYANHKKELAMLLNQYA